MTPIELAQPSMRRFFEALELSSETADVTALVNLFATLWWWRARTAHR